MEEQDWHAVQISSLMVSEGIELFDVWWLLLIFDSKATIYNQNLTACQAVPFMVVPVWSYDWQETFCCVRTGADRLIKEFKWRNKRVVSFLKHFFLLACNQVCLFKTLPQEKETTRTELFPQRRPRCLWIFSWRVWKVLPLKCAPFIKVSIEMPLITLGGRGWEEVLLVYLYVCVCISGLLWNASFIFSPMGATATAAVAHGNQISVYPPWSAVEAPWGKWKEESRSWGGVGMGRQRAPHFPIHGSISNSLKSWTVNCINLVIRARGEING